MRRNSLLAAVVLVVGVGVGLAADKAEKDKKGRTVSGIIKKVDPSARMLILSVKMKGEERKETDQVANIVSTTKVFVYTAEGKKELTGKDAFKDPKVKEGARATAIFDAEGKTLEVHIGIPARKGK